MYKHKKFLLFVLLAFVSLPPPCTGSWWLQEDFKGFLKTLLPFFKFEDVSKGEEMTQHRTIHWFRKGLRLHDNPALLSACDNCVEMRPIFILDPWFVQSGKVGANRWRFLMQSLQDLDDGLKKLDSRLFVLKGKPSEVLPRVFKEWNITRLTFEVDTEPYAVKRDKEIKDISESHGVEVIERVSHTLYDVERLIDANKGKAPLQYRSLQSIISRIGPPAKPKPALNKENMKVDEDHDEKYGVPSLEDLGIDISTLGPSLYPGGEQEALKRMTEHLQNKTWVCNFDKPKSSPISLKPSTTVLSPYLKFGCLSPRHFYYALDEVSKNKQKCTQPPVSLTGQLLWREFFYTAAAGTPNFDKMEGNPICLQVPWDNNTDYLNAWTEGRTGYPYIDAIMRQLRQEGWIHHLARHSVACFLTRGDLWISWEEGQKVFDELLLDADWSINAGNWMWLSASAFFHQYFRVYSPIGFGQKYDKDGEYIRKYVPVLKKMPSKYIYEPWTAPLNVQQKAGCVIGEDYPKPIVDHSIVRERNIQRMKAARANQSKGGGAASEETDSYKVKDSKKRKPVKENSSVKPTKQSKKITDFMTNGKR
ncbi:cryptochrome-1-like [Glandiceps talaboti]